MLQTTRTLGTISVNVGLGGSTSIPHYPNESHRPHNQINAQGLNGAKIQLY